ncbi:MAG: hypothetical protein H7259_05035 [Cytophagales bacterium]|nr:hypothetical protein [Cytophaga sp.]
MKKVIVSIVLFIKELGFIPRGIIIAASLSFLLGVAIPDLKFNMLSGKPVEISFEDVLHTPTDALPRYMKIIDAVVPSQSYVEKRNAEKNILQGIYYPVYSKEGVLIDADKFSEMRIDSAKESFNIVMDSANHIAIRKNTDNMLALLVIHDTQVTDSDLDSNGTYFSNPEFTIEGKYVEGILGADVLDLFQQSNLNVDPKAIILERGLTGVSTSNALLILFACSLLIALCLISLIPEVKLRAWADKE